MTQDFNSPAGFTEQPKKKSNLWWIIGVIVLLILICCCGTAAIGWWLLNWLWNNGDKLIQQLDIQSLQQGGKIYIIVKGMISYMFQAMLLCTIQ